MIIFTLIIVVKSLKGFGWNNVGPASQTVAHYYISIGPMYRVIWCFWRQDFKGHQHNAAVRKDGTFTQCCFNDRPAAKTVHGSTLKQFCLNDTCLCKVYHRSGDRLVLGQRRRRLTGIEPACNGLQRWPDIEPEFGG